MNSLSPKEREITASIYKEAKLRPVNGSDYEYQWLVKLDGREEFMLSPYRVNYAEVADFFQGCLIEHHERLEITKRSPKCTFVKLYAKDL
jgi:hypothetical protein